MLLFIIYPLFIGIIGIDDDLFKDLFNKINHPNSLTKNLSISQKPKQKYIKNEEIANNNHKIDTKPEIFQRIKNEKFDDPNYNKLKTNGNKPKVEEDQFNNEAAFVNDYNEDYSADSNSFSSSADNDESLHSVPKSKRKLGQKQKQKQMREEKDKKMKIIREFEQMYKEQIYGFKYDKNKRNKIGKEIAEKFGVSSYKIYQWRKEFDIIKKFSKQQKVEIIEKFEKIKHKLSETFNIKTTWKIDAKIAKNIGVGLTTIYKWKQEFGLIKRSNFSNAEKLEFVKKFEKMKKEKTHGFKYDRIKRKKLEVKIANEMGFSRNKIQEWKKELVGTKNFSNQQRHEIIEKFEKVKDEFAKKFNLKPSYEIERKIVGKIGVGLSTVYQWMRKFGLIGIRHKTYTDAERSELFEKIDKRKKRNPWESERKIAKELGVSRVSIMRWRKKSQN